jgi:formiminoglutamase
MTAADLSIYFSPLDRQVFASGLFNPDSFGGVIDRNDGRFPEWNQCQIAIFGVKEERLSRNNKGCAEAPDYVRRYLYKLFPPAGQVKVCDLGNIMPGDRIEDTYFAVKSVAGELLKHNILPVIIGGSQDLTHAVFSAYEKLEQTINMLSIDRIFDLGHEQNEFDSESYLNRIILHEPNYLFNYSNIGYQTYFLSDTAMQLMEKLYFDTYRLGEFKNNIAGTEPIVRNADLVSVDMSAIRQSDAPGVATTGPNGFYGEDVCQMCRYAGMSDKLTAIGFFEMNPSFDRQGQTAHLLAQMIWCVVDGFVHRKKDFPFRNEQQYIKYQIFIKDFDHEMLFYKSKLSDRWWMSVPYPPGNRSRFERHHLVPCAYSDYQLACNEEVPDLWWKTFQKIT